MPKRIHHELIQQWLEDDTTIVEFYDKETKGWLRVNPPMWAPSVKYRIKPKQEVHYAAVFPTDISNLTENPTTYDNLKLTFQDGKLINAEVGERGSFCKTSRD